MEKAASKIVRKVSDDQDPNLFSGILSNIDIWNPDDKKSN